MTPPARPVPRRSTGAPAATAADSRSRRWRRGRSAGRRRRRRRRSSMVGPERLARGRQAREERLGQRPRVAARHVERTPAPAVDDERHVVAGPALRRPRPPSRRRSSATYGFCAARNGRLRVVEHDVHDDRADHAALHAHAASRRAAGAAPRRRTARPPRRAPSRTWSPATPDRPTVSGRLSAKRLTIRPPPS